MRQRPRPKRDSGADADEVHEARSSDAAYYRRSPSARASEAGFDRRYGKGDHWVYTHERRRYPLTIDPRNPLLPAYVSKAIRAIEEVLADDSADPEDA